MRTTSPATHLKQLTKLAAVSLVLAGLAVLAGCQGLSITGTSKQQQSGYLSLASANLNFGNVAAGGKKTLTVTATNTGNTAITVTKAAISTQFFSLIAPSLPATINAGQSTSISITFLPNTQGTFNANLSVTSNASNPQTTVSLTGLGTAATVGQLVINPTSESFGSITLGNTQSQVVTLTNAGSAGATISQVSVSGTGFKLTGITTPLTLSPNNSTTMSVSFTPQSVGNATGTVNITSDASDSTLAMVLSGTGLSAGSVTSNPSSLSFGNVQVGSSQSLSEKITNAGGSSVTISGVGITGTGFSLSGIATPVILKAGQSATFTVSFTPSTAGSVSGDVTVSSNASNLTLTLPVSGTGITGTTLGVLASNPASLSFGNVNLGQNQTLLETITNTGGSSVTISQVAISGSGFGLSGITAPLTLAAGQNISFNVTFTPTTTGAVSGNVTITSTASSPTLVVPLSGTGSGSGGSGSACTGSAITQTPANVTSQLSSVGAGITVTQLTNANDVGGSWNTYADIPMFSSPTNVLLYNYGGNPAAVASANLDGTGAQVISGSAQGTQVQVTGDGKFAYYQGQNTDGSADVYAVPISQSGTCQQNRLSQRSMSFIAPAAALIISTSSFDSKSGHNVIAFSEGLVLHEVLDDGTALPDLTLGDPENNDVFHRMRLNPAFPDVLWYKRDQPAPNPNGIAQPEIWVVNLQSPNTVYSVTGTIAADHASWSKDGTKLGYIYNGYWYQADVLNTDGSFNLNSSGGFTLTQIGPPASSGFTVDFCNLSPDASVYVCAQSYRAIYLMSLDGTQTKFLASPDSSSTGAIYNGIPKPLFLDMQHIAFSSDRTGSPQVYVITGFTTTFP